MRRKTFLPNMVQAIAVLTVLKMLTNAQTTCNHGLGRVVYERIPDHQLQGFNDDIVKDTMPPFRMLEKCQDLCLRDRTAVNNLVRTCTSFNFQPGVRIASFSGTPEYEESICYLTQEQAHPEGIGNLVLVPNSVHFTEVCLSSLRIDRECSNRRYVFERHPRKKLKLLASDHKEIQASNRTDCEERCLNENAFVCRSVTYNSVERTCSMTRFTRRSHPELMQDDPNSDYLENTCLSPERRCDGLAVFVKEENKRLGGPFEVDMYVNISLEECQNLCLRAEKYFCRSIEYDDRRRECIISEEDSVSQKDDLRTSSSLNRHLFDLVCLDARSNEFPDNSVTSHLFSDGRRPDTAFQRYRNSRLGGEFHSEITSRTLSECLDECLRQASFQCRSAVYSERFRVCRLSRFNQRDGHRIIYDADYDYYENLMTGEGDGLGGGYRPDPLGQDTFYNSQGRPPYQANPSYPNNYPSNYPANPSYPTNSYPGYINNNNPSSWNNPYPSNNYPGSSGYPGNNYNGYGGNGYQGGSGGYYGNGYQSYPGYGGGPVGGNGYSNGDRFGSGAPYGPPGPVAPPPPHYGGAVGGGVVGGGGGYPSSNYPSNYPTHYPNPSGYPPQPGPAYPANNDIFGPNKFTSRCDESDNFRQVGVRLRLRRPFLRRYISAPTLAICERECADSRDFNCKSFNYRSGAGGPVSPYPSPGPERDNCELSDKDSRELDVNNPAYFETSGDYDYFERSPSRQGAGQDCLDVSQQCSEDGMEFALKTPEGFFGRIYTYGFYDRCFFRGNGGTINVLRISGAQGYPECGTQRYGDTMTNIVVVQFSDFVQTGRDKRYNLTCLFRGPGEAVVTSGYIGAGSGSPIPIEYLPAENSLSSKVRLMILYQNRPTTTIAVGDPLTFRLEAQDNYNYPTDIFASNVIARDPYSGRSVQLIDRFGCPVDNFVFPGLDRSREGDGLEARFNAFKIPESNFLVFEATVKTCRDGCQPAYCTGQTGRSEASFGRRRRREVESLPSNGTEDTLIDDADDTFTVTSSSTTPAQITIPVTPGTTSTPRSATIPSMVPPRSTAATPRSTSAPPRSSGWTAHRASPILVETPKDPKPTPQQIAEDVIRELIVVVDNRENIAEQENMTNSLNLVESEKYDGGLQDGVFADSIQPCVTNRTFMASLVSLGVIIVILVAVILFILRKSMMNRKESDLYVDPRPSPSKIMSMLNRSKVEPGLLSRFTGIKAPTVGSQSSAHPSHWNDAPQPTDNFAGSVTKRFRDLFSPTVSNGNFSMAAATAARYSDPSEPIYTDPSLFELERSRSFRSIAGPNNVAP